ncbi:MAG: 4Fe-4S cluster-binding domain-containing protein [Acidobacteria bacterium]|nr:4Fe-4S cluster-binding domain-containing protein [Acidobacteriota bacterium]
MKKEITLVLEPDNGKLTAEVSGISNAEMAMLHDDLGGSHNVNCGKPLQKVVSEQSDYPIDATSADDSQSIWLYRIYHNSVVDGPGRRIVIQVAGCSIRCPGCYVPETHNRQNGRLVRVPSIVEEIKQNINEHDGVTILGGEPFDQPGPVAEIVYQLRRLGIHITVYSGNTIATLLKQGNANIHYILTHIDLLIDGPFIQSLTRNAGEYRGSQNQRLIFDPRPDNISSVQQ